MGNVVSKLTDGRGDEWFSFYCPGCKCSHLFNRKWQFNDNLEKPTVSPSLLVNGNLENPTTPRCHIFVRDGNIQYLDDCTHSLAGTNVPMEPE